MSKEIKNVENKRELVTKVFNNEKADRVPVGFWFHFAKGSEFNEGLTNPEVIKKNIAGHEKYFNEFHPDFLKLMSDGFFRYPNEAAAKVRNAVDLAKVEPIGADHPWITEQVKLVKELTKRFGSEVLSFYNIFSPLTYLSLLLEDSGITVEDLFKESPEALGRAVVVIAEDIAALSKGVIAQGGADGIYFSAKNLQDASITKEDYLKFIAPAELKVLEAANSVSDTNILHICGYEGSRNDLTTYVDYPAKVINWAVNVEQVSLAEGKKLFGGRAVIGGFDNRPGQLLHKGSKEEIEAFTEQLLQLPHSTGVVLGADCTIPSDTEFEHLEWVRSKAKEISEGLN